MHFYSSFCYSLPNIPSLTTVTSLKPTSNPTSPLVLFYNHFIKPGPSVWAPVRTIQQNLVGSPMVQNWMQWLPLSLNLSVANSSAVRDGTSEPFLHLCLTSQAYSNTDLVLTTMAAECMIVMAVSCPKSHVLIFEIKLFLTVRLPYYRYYSLIRWVGWKYFLSPIFPLLIRTLAMSN